MFFDGEALERVIETSEGLFWLIAMVKIKGKHLILSEFLMYSATSTRQQVGVRPQLEVLRTIKREAREQGLVEYTLFAERMYVGKPKRMITMTGRL
jgi:hypothetical protein